MPPAAPPAPALPTARPSVAPVLVAAAALVLAGFAGLLAAQPVSAAPHAALLAWGLACAGWALAARHALGAREASRRELLLVLGVAVVVRLAALGAPASDDVHRYLWEARVLSAGHDPYVLAPDAPELAELAAGDPDQPLVNHPGWTAIYPPVMQWLQAGVLTLHDSAVALKLAWLAAEAVLLALLAVELASRGRSPGQLVLWAWCPLPVLAGAMEGHHDVVAATLLVAALVAHARRVAAWPALLALAVCAKPLAVAALPALLPRPGDPRRPPWWAWPAALVLPAAAAWPFVAGGGLFDSLLAFGGQLHTGDVLPDLLARLLGRPAATRACALLGLGLGLWVWRRGPDDPWQRAAWLLGGLLLLLPTVHVWYPLVLLPVLVVVPWPAWLWAAVAGPVIWLTWPERLATGRWVEWPALKLIVWLPVAAALLVAALARLRPAARPTSARPS